MIPSEWLVGRSVSVEKKILYAAAWHRRIHTFHSMRSERALRVALVNCKVTPRDVVGLPIYEEFDELNRIGDVTGFEMKKLGDGACVLTLYMEIKASGARRLPPHTPPPSRRSSDVFGLRERSQIRTPRGGPRKKRLDCLKGAKAFMDRRARASQRKLARKGMPWHGRRDTDPRQRLQKKIRR